MKRVFFFHYNKPASQKAGCPKLTVHWKGVCIIVDRVDCRPSCFTRIRSTQPRCVMAGKANEVIIQNDKGIQTAVIQ